MHEHPDQPQRMTATCETCGQVHPGCARHNRTGAPCKNRPVNGTTVCAAPTHGGRLPRVRAAARQRVAEEQVRSALARLDAPPVEDPFTALAQLAGQVVSWKDALAGQVNALTGEPCVTCGGGGRHRYEAVGAGTEQLRAEVALFERALDRCASVLGLIAKLDIDSRLARITEQQAAAVLRVVDVVIAKTGATGQAAADARQAAVTELRRAA